jgi:hypothetical protein
MAIFRPRIAMSYLEQAISSLRSIAKRLPRDVPALEMRMYERMRAQLRQTYRIECCDLPRRAQSEDARKKGE